MPSKCRPQRLPDNSSVLGLPGAETVGLAEKVEGVLAAVGGGESEEVGGLRTGSEVEEVAAAALRREVHLFAAARDVGEYSRHGAVDAFQLRVFDLDVHYLPEGVGVHGERSHVGRKGDAHVACVAGVWRHERGIDILGNVCRLHINKGVVDVSKCGITIKRPRQIKNAIT